MHTTYAHLNALNSTLEGSISTLESERVLQYHNKNGSGKVISAEIDDHIDFFKYDLDLAQNLKLNFKNSNASNLYFIYCLEGSLKYSWSGNVNVREEIQELQTVILGNDNSTLQIYIAKDVKTNFAIIKVSKSNRYVSKNSGDVSLMHRLFEKYKKKNGNVSLEYHGTFNLHIREQFLQIKNIKDTGVIRKLLISGIVHFVLALQLRHHARDTNLDNTFNANLTKSEFVRVKNVVKIIEENPQHEYRVANLSRQCGLSASKMQLGFKALEGCTVSHFIKRKRVEMAEVLIQEGDLNISEIVYSIGFTSRSYFSKIFKMRYNCTPKYYQDHCRNLVVS